MIQFQDLISRLGDYMHISRVNPGARYISLEGEIHKPYEESIKVMRELIKEAGYTPFFEKTKDETSIHMLRIGLFSLRNVKQRFWLNWMLLGITVITTTIAGAIWAGADIFTNPLLIYMGLPFACALLFILGSHELGHYFACRYYKMQATPPFFIPFLPFFAAWIPAAGWVFAPSFGTMGAIIRMGITPNRRALVRVGAAGPIIGFLVAIPITILGLALSQYKIPELSGGITFEDPIVFKFLVWIVDMVKKATPGPGEVLHIHPIALAGWLGFLVTSLNLLPLSQLDGGHIAYGVFGKRRFYLTIAAYALMGAAIVWTFIVLKQPSMWILWAVITVFLGFRHPPSEDEITPLSRGDIIISIAALVVFVLTAMVAPIR